MTASGNTGWVAKLLVPPVRCGAALRDTAWNAAVNAALAGLTFLALALAAHWAGAYWAGVVALGVAMSQQLFTLGNFAMQGYQASDVSESRPFSAYVGAKCLSVGAMLLAGGVWILLGGLAPDKALVFAPLLLFYASDAFGMAFFGRYQQKGRLDTACKVRFAKLAAFAGIYAGVLWATGNPAAALWAGAAAHVLLFFCLDAPLLRVFGPVGWRRPGRPAVGVLWACAPLAANSFLAMYVNNGPRFAVDAELGEETLAAYGALFMVSFGVAVCGDFLMNPQLVRLAEAVRGEDRGRAWSIVLRQACLIGGLGAAVMGAGAFAGIPVLSWLFSLPLDGLADVLLILLGGGVLLAFHQLAQTVLVVVRRQALGTPGMLLAAAGMFLAARPVVARWGLRGAAWSYFAAMALLFLCSGGFALHSLNAALARPQPRRS